MDDGEFRRRLIAIVSDPQPMFPQSDPATETPYLELCDLFLDGDVTQRAEIRRQWPFGRMWRIPSPGTTVDRPGGELSEGRLMGSLVALALQPNVGDARDILLGLPIDYWVAKQIGLDPDSLFRRVAELAIPEVREILLEFTRRPGSLKTPQYMGWRMVETSDGPRWKASW